MSEVSDATPLVDVLHLSVAYPTRRDFRGRVVRAVTAVDDVSFTIRRGETLGLVGESGCGKTSTARATLLLDRPTAGEIRFDGQDIMGLNERELRALRPRMQMIHQDPASTLNPRMKVRDIVAEPFAIHGIGTRRDREEWVRGLLETVGLTGAHMSRYPHQFSGGQNQRIGIARALALDPKFVVCDEPTSALDVSVRAQVLNLLTELQERRGLTYLFIAHDLRVVDHVSDRVAVMYLGRVVEAASPAQINQGARHPYTVALLSAMPSVEVSKSRRQQRVVLDGDLPSPSSPPPGCSFHTRCWLYQKLGRPDACRTDDPSLRTVGHEHVTACHFTDESSAVAVG